MKVKKFASLIMVIATFISVCKIPVFANISYEKYNYQQNNLFENSTNSGDRLLKNNLVSSVDELSQGIFKFEYLSDNNSTYGLVDKLSSGFINYPDSYNSKCKTTETYIAKDIESKNQVLTSLYSNSSENGNYRSTLDSTCSIKIYTNVYFSEYISGDRKYCKITKITGGYSKLDRICSVVSQKLSYGQASGTQSYHTYTYPSGSSWTVVPPTSWPYVQANATVAVVIGSYLDVSIKRCSSPWNTRLENYIYNSAGSIYP